jgi:hypothetical protein
MGMACASGSAGYEKNPGIANLLFLNFWTAPFSSLSKG